MMVADDRAVSYVLLRGPCVVRGFFNGAGYRMVATMGCVFGGEILVLIIAKCRFFVFCLVLSVCFNFFFRFEYVSCYRFSGTYIHAGLPAWYCILFLSKIFFFNVSYRTFRSNSHCRSNSNSCTFFSLSRSVMIGSYDAACRGCCGSCCV